MPFFHKYPLDNTDPEANLAACPNGAGMPVIGAFLTTTA
jgi:hypothetical protein